MKALHAYLKGADELLSAKTFFIDAATTGIQTKRFANAQAVIKVYNLNGQYVGGSTVALPKGIYVVNGRKMIVR